MGPQDKAQPRRHATRLVALGVGLSSWALLTYNTASWCGNELEVLHRHTSRYWEDMAVATSNYVNAASGAAASTASLASHTGGDLRNAYKRYMPKAAAEQGIRPWQFWRTIPIKPFLQRERLEQRPYDDPGRALLMRIGFHVLGGVAPYLGVWLGVLFCGPVLAWIAWELFAAGRAAAGVVLPVLLASSGFVVEVLALPYSAVGYYVIGVLVLVAFAVYAILAPRPTARGLLLRALIAGACLALFILCRSGTSLLVPGFLLAAIWGVARAAGGPAEDREAVAPARSRRVQVVLGLALAGALLLPYLLVRQPRHHGVWGDVWQGLGDFDRTKGHYWSDGELRQMLRRQGLRIGRNVGVDFESAATEALLRRIVLRDITGDPAWYLGILARRVLATVSQWKLTPYGPRDGLSMWPQTSDNEGLTDAYYRMVAPIDVFGVGAWRREWRLALLWVPPLALLAAWGVARRRGPPARAARLGGELGVSACLGLATLPIPVLFSTSTAFETQAFALAYVAAAAFLVDELLRLAAARLRSAASR